MGSMNDPIADLLTRISNASKAEHRFIDIGYSKLKEAIVKILKEKGFIAHYLVKEEKKIGTVRIFLKYTPSRKAIINGLKRISKPSIRRYISYKDIPRVMGGMGIAILSTPVGVLEGGVARHQKVGGELLCLVW
jgi:small subunit ribosomal protein S8